jgi:hypothetical protein
VVSLRNQTDLRTGLLACGKTAELWCRLVRSGKWDALLCGTSEEKDWN